MEIRIFYHKIEDFTDFEIIDIDLTCSASKLCGILLGFAKYSLNNKSTLTNRFNNLEIKYN